MAPSRIDDNAVSAAIPTITKTAAAAAPVSPTSSTVSRTFGTTSMIESKFLSHPEDLGVVAVGFSGGQVCFFFFFLTFSLSCSPQKF